MVLPGDARDDGRVVVRLDDETFVDGMARLRWQLRHLLAGGARVIVVDLAGLRQLSSTSVAALLSTHRVCRSRGGGVVVRKANRRTLDLLRRTGLHHVFEIETHVETQQEMRNAG
ncbi:STAS domain-containing protein [Tenggerimyces flavus]|uniref:STAS domain-containing protein n=1 Tax=Tenggerimyces flavus TaxID=1708749 RepID=A0ABV7YH34_9ACTN|nr:STAS domain-containing protein [Tenggerimyces flavus]MBM7788154.1 anti-anti-sigma factor [Tenggerimyces flavus]